MTIPKTEVLGVGVSAVNFASATAEMLRWIAEGEKYYVSVADVHGVIEAQDDPEFKKILNDSGLIVPDGRPIFWLLRLAGHGDVTQTTGSDLIQRFSEALAERGYSAFYYGGAPGVAENVAAVLEDRYPGLRTADTYCPPFRDLDAREEAEIVDMINVSGAHVVWVGLGAPKQERWMARFIDRLDVPVLVGVGAVFDFLTGRVKRCPRWLQIVGLEWLYRISQEPRRLWKRYARSNSLFLYYLLCERLGLRDFRSN